MFAWKSVLITVCVVMTAGCLPGCENIQVRAKGKFGYVTNDGTIFGFIDIDPERAHEFLWDGREMKYYPGLGGVHDPATGEFIRSDDPVWPLFNLPTLGTPWGGQTEPAVVQVENFIGSVFIFPAWSALFDASSTELRVVVNGTGDMALPHWDVQRWRTLQRTLFVFPDGMRGSADPMTVEVSGTASDVFGYLNDLGLLNIDACVDGSNWSIVFDSNNQLVDIFVDESFVISISLPH